MRFRPVGALVGCCFVVGTAMAVAGARLERVRDEASYAAFVHVPALLQTEEKVPLLLYLHGAGESGVRLDDILSEGATGTPPTLCAAGEAALLEPFLVAAPQTSVGWRPETVDRFVTYLLAAFPQLDEQRLYITGHSMGGAGALRAAAATRRFAAVAAVAPAGTPRAPALRAIPVWLFHGRNDAVVPASYSTHLVDALRAAGAADDDARLTLYDEAPTPPGWPDSVGHASTIPAYATPELYSWLLAHRLP